MDLDIERRSTFPAKVMDPKDPDAVLDYSVDWGLWLGDDTVLASEWRLETSGPRPVAKVSDSHSSTVATIWIKNGIAGGRYRATNRIRTVGGRTDSRTIEIPVEQR